MFPLQSFAIKKNTLQLQFKYGLTVNIKRYFFIFTSVKVTRYDNEIVAMGFTKPSKESLYQQYKDGYYTGVINHCLDKIKALE